MASNQITSSLRHSAGRGAFCHERVQARSLFITIILIVSAAYALSSCTSISLSKPTSPDFGTIILLSVDPNGTPVDNGAATVQVIRIQTFDGAQHLDIPSENPHMKAFYLQPGKYTLKLDCRRNWPLPDNGATARLPYGLGLDDASETFQISVERGQRYLLDCIPSFYSLELPTHASHIHDEVSRAG